MGKLNELADKTNSLLISADATKNEDLDNLIDQTLKHFNGKIDFVLHSIGMSVNVRKGKSYTELNHEWLSSV
jgi:enoyl-[acyl-carrier protein] reductase I